MGDRDGMQARPEFGEPLSTGAEALGIEASAPSATVRSIRSRVLATMTSTRSIATIGSPVIAALPEGSEDGLNGIAIALVPDAAGDDLADAPIQGMVVLGGPEDMVDDDLFSTVLELALLGQASIEDATSVHDLLIEGLRSPRFTALRFFRLVRHDRSSTAGERFAHPVVRE